jgi:ubiquinone biosynthesis monooxygenase Coq7
MRQRQVFDPFIQVLDQALNVLLAPAIAERPNPGGNFAESELSVKEKQEVAALMRINHAGEIAAQGLYHGQALTAKLSSMREKMQQASREENDHLAWCAERLAELNSQPSLLQPLWYWGAFFMGATAGAVGDRWSLGFVAETEKQVVHHLQGHLERLPPQDAKTRAILEQMQADEARHREDARAAGGETLPLPIQTAMQSVSKVMTSLAGVV